MMVLLLSMISYGVNCESSHLLSLWAKLLLVCIFPYSIEGDQLPSCTYSLNEWIPWSWEAIQGGHKNLSFFHILFGCFKLFLYLRNPCEVELHGLWVMYLHILKWVTQCHLSIDIISIIQDGHCTEHILGILQGWYMWDPMETEIILLDLTKSVSWCVFISL